MIKKAIKTVLFNNITNKKLTNFISSNLIIKNINLDFCNRNQKKVLISYISTFLHQDFTNSNIYYTNIYEVNQITRIFINKGYCVDIINHGSINLVKEKYNEYDIVFGFGKVFEYVSKNNLRAIKILYVTESEPEFSLHKEKERINYYYLRHKKRLNIVRSGVYYNKDSFKNITHLILLGEKSQFVKYNYPKFNLFPTGLQNSNYIFNKRNYNISKKHFLWFGSNGAIHKGLDILIDVFKKTPHLYLHICGLKKTDNDILRIPNNKNIINHGLINVKSNKYLEIVETCSFIVCPSCAEASATSVLTCMNHSMIPIVTSDIGFNSLSDFCIYLHDYHINYITKAIINASKINIKILHNMHKAVYAYSKENFNLYRFTKEMTEILDAIIN